MKEKVNALAVGWKADKLRGSLMVCWVITVFSSFFGSYLLPIAVPALGSIFLFRIALPIAAVLYILYAIREKEAIWRGVSALEKWCYVFAAVMLVYAAGSLFRAMDFMRTFRMLFNLCFDMCFFLLMLRLCREYEVPVIVSSDAHDPLYVGRFQESCDLLNDVGFDKQLIINTSVEKFMAHIRMKG